MVNPSPNPEISLYALMAYYLRFLRQKHKMTQTQVGQLINCTKSQVSKYEGGTRQLDEHECAVLDKAWDTGGLFTILLRFAKLGVDPNWLHPGDPRGRAASHRRGRCVYLLRTAQRPPSGIRGDQPQRRPCH